MLGVPALGSVQKESCEDAGVRARVNVVVQTHCYGLEMDILQRLALLCVYLIVLRVLLLPQGVSFLPEFLQPVHIFGRGSSSFLQLRLQLVLFQ